MRKYMNRTPDAKTLTFARACNRRLDLLYFDNFHFKYIFNSFQIAPGIYKLYEKGVFNRYSDQEWYGQDLIPSRFDEKQLCLNTDPADFIEAEGALRRKFE